MEQLKELANDPAKLEAKLKEDWAKMDTKGEGSITFAQFEEAGKKMQSHFDPEKMKGKAPEDKEKFKKLLDPDNTGKITYDNFVKFVKAGLEKLKGK